MKNDRVRSTADHATELVATFVGSWWAVVIHLVWFSVWLIYDLSIESLTLWVSLEAIFIGIFLLMAENREQKQRKHLEDRRVKHQMQELKEDKKIDLETRQRLDEMEKTLSEIRDAVKK